MKSDSCCDGEEDDSTTEENGCCKDEGYVFKSAADFTLKQYDGNDLVKVYSELFYVKLPFYNNTFPDFIATNFNVTLPPPKLQQTEVITTTVLRI